MSRTTGPVHPRADRLKVSELLDDYLAEAELNRRRSIPDIKRRVKRIRAAFGHRAAQSVPGPEIRSYQLGRQRQGAAAATINRELAILRRAFRLGIEAEKIHRAPVIRQLQENNVRSGFFDDDAFAHPCTSAGCLCCSSAARRRSYSATCRRRSAPSAARSGSTARSPLACWQSSKGT